MNAEWTIDELSDRVATALSVDYPGQSNRQIREIPSPRTIRYYTTLGLLDRPGEMRGRTAYYGARHLMQIVAVKRLQAEGCSLSEVQEVLAGLSEKKLAALARLPDATSVEPLTEQPAPSQDGAPGAPRREGAFWAAVPAAAEHRSAAPPALAPAPPGVAPELLRAVRLAEGLILMMGVSRPIDGDDLTAIGEAAGPLIALLEQRGLLAGRSERS